MDFFVAPISRRQAVDAVVRHHYLHRKCQVRYAYGLLRFDGTLLGVVTFGLPPSPTALRGACPTHPERVIELNRLWVSDTLGRNSETWFLARALRQLPPFIVISYADTAHGHKGYVYRAANFHYAGWSDMERKHPRVRPVLDNERKHGRWVKSTKKVPLSMKVKYWATTGSRGERRGLARLCKWPILDWKTLPPPDQHRQHIL